MEYKISDGIDFTEIMDREDNLSENVMYELQRYNPVIIWDRYKKDQPQGRKKRGKNDNGNRLG